jgi:hypothetical protein
MLHLITHAAYELDRWLKHHIGRPYTVVLGASLIAGIVTAIQSLMKEIGTTTHVTTLVGAVAVQTLLLINQLGQLHEYREANRIRREARRRRKTGAGDDPASSEPTTPS